MAVDIKNLSEYSEKIKNVSHILTETLGTTTSYSFLEDTLRPYVKKNLKEYVRNHWNDSEVVEIVEALKKQAELELKEGWVGGVEIPDGEDSDATKEAVISYALSQMEGSNLESLSRLVVKDGYSKGQLKGHVFPDVLPAFKKWSEDGKRIYLYSSGMELSQQCLMSNTIDGDMSELISGCFESSEFPAAKSESFRELCKKVDSSAEKVALLTHNATTACAAHKAGLVVIMLSRDGNSYIGHCTRESFPVITSFEDISKQICGKRKAPAEEGGTEGKRAKLDGQVSDKEAEVKPEESKVDSMSEVKPKEEVAAAPVAAEVVPETKDSTDDEKMEVEDEAKETSEKTDGSEVKIVITPPVDEVPAEKVSEEVNGAPEVKETVEHAKDEVKKTVEKAADEAKETVEKANDETKVLVKDEVEAGSDKVEDESKETVEEVKDEAKEAVEKVKDEAKEAVKEVNDEAKEGVIEAKEEAKEAVEEVKDEVKENVEVKDTVQEVERKEECDEKSEVSSDVAEKKAEKESDVSKSEAKEEKGGEDAKAAENVKDDGQSESKASEGTETAAENLDKVPSPEEELKENGVSDAKLVENGKGDGAASDQEDSEKKVNENGVSHVNGGGDGAAAEGDTTKPEKETEIVAKKVDKDNKVEVAAEAVEEKA